MKKSIVVALIITLYVIPAWALRAHDDEPIMRVYLNRLRVIYQELDEIQTDLARDQVSHSKHSLDTGEAIVDMHNQTQNILAASHTFIDTTKESINSFIQYVMSLSKDQKENNPT